MGRKARKGSTPERDRTILKFLSIWNDPKVTRDIVRKAPNNVIKSIVNAVLNIQRSEHLRGHIEPGLKRKLAKHRRQIARITNQGGSLEKRRQLILQHGGQFLSLLPILLSTVLSTLGPAVLPKILGD